MLELGSTLDDRYKILKLIGKGGMGSVYLAENIKLGNKWAIKEIDYTANKGINLLAEPQILTKLNHKSLPRIVDIIKTEKFIYIVQGKSRYLKLTQICSFLLKSDVQFLLHRVANARTLHRLTPCNSRH